MIVKNKYYYFGAIPDLPWYEETPEGWEPGWYYRIRISPEDEEIKIEDTNNRMVPLPFEAMYSLRQVLNKIQDHLINSILGVPEDA